jgi:nucleotide-binding universal stress UspA family protein
MSEKKNSVLVFGDGSESARSASQWARRFARANGAKFFFETPPETRVPAVLDLASKQDVDYLVCGLRSRRVGSVSVPDVDAELAALMRRAPCPMWMIQPWAAERGTRFSVAVVGVDASPEANAAAHAAAALLSRSESAPRLCLVHGLEVHPDELAASQPWSEVAAAMAPDRHPWLERMARELDVPHRVVEVVVRPVFAPELIGGIARCTGADFVALGSGWLSESAEVRASRLVRQVLRATSCPILSV